MKATLLQSGDPEWQATLRRLRHDIYHLPEYVELSATLDGGQAVAVQVVEDDWVGLIPLVLRNLPNELGAPETWCDAVSPYGYPAPLVADGTSGATLSRFLRSFSEACVATNVVSVFLRLHPLLGVRPVDLEGFGVVVDHGQTVYVDLGKRSEELEGQIRKGHRYEIRKLMRLGFKVEIDCWEEYDAFVRIYRDTMRRLDADEYYFFADAYFQDLKSNLRSCLHPCIVRSPEGDVAAAALFSECAGLVQYLFSGTAGRFRKLAPTKLILSSVIKWARSHGFEVLHLGGGVGAEDDSLFKFKAGFSDLRSDYATFRVVPDRSRFDFLVRQRQSIGGPEPNGKGDFFPPYRSSESSSR